MADPAAVGGLLHSLLSHHIKATYNFNLPDREEDDEGESMQRFSTIARKGSSSHASPTAYPRQNVPEAMDRNNGSDDGEYEDASAATTACADPPPAARREFQRLAAFNNPGWDETSATGKRTRRKPTYDGD